MLILGIESSCDDTSVALIESSDQGHIVIAEKTASQIDVHKKYGGVVPEIAGRMHAEKIVPLIEEVLHPRDPSLTSPYKGEDMVRPDAIAVTSGPGLITGLIVGVEAARTLSYSKGIPLVSVNHTEGHIHSVEISNKKIEYPAISLIVSGGHTELIYIKEQGNYEVIGKTKDDAAGECFDKVAKLLDLPYPGGPQISKLALTGNTQAIAFPRPMTHEKNFDFSFSGLKTSALYWLRDNNLAVEKIIPYDLPTGIYGQPPNPPTLNDFCASFEQAIVDVLTEKTLNAAEKYKPKTIILAGGVSANQKLRSTLEEMIKRNYPKITLQYPQIQYCMDNAAMIATAGYYKAIKKDFTDWKNIKADPNWEIDMPNPNLPSPASILQ